MADTAARDAERIRVGIDHVAAALGDALAHLGLLHDQVDPMSQKLYLRDVRWSTAEAQRLLRYLRLDLDRLAGPIPPERSLHASMHTDQADAASPEETPP